MYSSNDFRKEYPYRTELHSHTKPVSPCSEIPTEDYVERYIKLGYDSVVLTNHLTHGIFTTFADADEYTEYYLKYFREARDYGEKRGLNVLLGLEVRFEESFNDYLVYGVDEEFTRTTCDYLARGLADYYREMKNERNVILQAHPFRDKMDPVRPEFLDGVEAFNFHPNHNSRQSVTARYAKEHDMLVSGGTDFHHPGQEGQVAMLTKKVMKSSFDVAEALKSKDILFDVGGSIVIPY